MRTFYKILMMALLVPFVSIGCQEKPQRTDADYLRKMGLKVDGVAAEKIVAKEETSHHEAAEVHEVVEEHQPAVEMPEVAAVSSPEEVIEEQVAEVVDEAAPVESVVEAVENTIIKGDAMGISGTIRYDGEVPKFKEIKMDADPICLTKHTSAVSSPSLVVGDDHGLGNVFVHITKGLEGKKFPVPSDEVVLTQAGCMYAPHVLGVMVGQPLKILNPDGTLHNVHSSSKVNPEFNVAMPKFRQELTQTFQKAEFMFPLKCDVHPWMNAWISVMDHPYFDVTGEDGKFMIKNLDPGTYEIEAWHEKLGVLKETVTINEGETAQINLVFSRPTK